MPSLILHETAIAQWHALLNEAQRTSSILLKEDLESYLVFLLMRFCRDPDLAASVLGLEFLNGYQDIVARHRHDLLKDVGDRCLLYAGLFPGRATKKRVKISYFVKLGQTAYSTVSNYAMTQEGLFSQLCQEFPKLMDVLHAMRDTSGVDLLQSLELWHETGSQGAWQRLCSATHALPIVPPYKKSIN